MDFFHKWSVWWVQCRLYWLYSTYRISNTALIINLNEWRKSQCKVYIPLAVWWCGFGDYMDNLCRTGSKYRVDIGTYTCRVVPNSAFFWPVSPNGVAKMWLTLSANATIPCTPYLSTPTTRGADRLFNGVHPQCFIHS